MREDKLSIAIFAQEEPIFISRILQFVLDRQGSHKYIIEEVVLFKPSRHNKTKFDWFQERIKMFRFHELFILFYVFLYTTVSNIIYREDSKFNIKGILKRNKVHFSKCRDLNSKRFVEKIKSKNLDLIISISCPQIFKTDIIRSTNRGCINVHGTLLPRHRGIQGAWWTIFFGDKSAGSTVHFIEEGIDSGNVILQKKFNLTKKYSQFRLAYLTKRLSAYILVQALFLLRKSDYKGIAMDPLSGNYNYNPSIKDINKFNKRGNRLIYFSDLKYLLSTNSSF